MATTVGRTIAGSLLWLVFATSLSLLLLQVAGIIAHPLLSLAHLTLFVSSLLLLQRMFAARKRPFSVDSHMRRIKIQKRVIGGCALGTLAVGGFAVYSGNRGWGLAALITMTLVLAPAYLITVFNVPPAGE